MHTQDGRKFELDRRLVGSAWLGADCESYVAPGPKYGSPRRLAQARF